MQEVNTSQQVKLSKLLSLVLRHQSHNTDDLDTAIRTGRRYGKPVVLEVNSESMISKKYQFYRSNNGVWLTETVPTDDFNVLEKLHVSQSERRSDEST